MPSTICSFRTFYEIINLEQELPDPEVTTRLAALFHFDKMRIERLLRTLSPVIKTELNKDTALKYQRAIERTGAYCRIIPKIPIALPVVSERQKSSGEQKAPEKNRGLCISWRPFVWLRNLSKGIFDHLADSAIEAINMEPKIVYGDILKQDVEVIVNAWNRNIIPWWLLLPQGVSGAIKKKGGYRPFKELAKFGPIPLGEARQTSAGNLPFQAIIHVAGINTFWLATQYSVTNSVKNAMDIVKKEGYRSVAFPLIGAGSGNRNQEWSLGLMLETFKHIEAQAEVLIVRYKKL